MGRPPKKPHVGRPTNKEVAARERAEKQQEKETTEKFLNTTEFYKCTRCGKISLNPVGNFYTILNNNAFDGNKGRSHLCIDCVNKFFNEYKEKYGDEKIALMLVCMNMGVYFSESLYDIMHEKEMQDPDKNEFSIGKYVRQLSCPQYKKQTFLSYMIDLIEKQKGMGTIADARDRLEDGWKVADKRNKVMCIKEVGYDCFDDTMYSSADRKMMFNSLAQYLNDGDIAEDKHRRDAAISIVKTGMQVEFLDRELNKESRSLEPDYGRIEKLINAKRNLNTVITTMAKENAISTSGAGKRTSSSLAVTSIMKELVDNGVLEAKVNLTDVKMTDAFQSIADISAKALLKEMNITGDEYAVLVGKQADTIRSLTKRVEELEEQLRVTLVQLHEKTSKKKKYIKHTVDYDEDGLAVVDEDLFSGVEGDEEDEQ